MPNFQEIHIIVRDAYTPLAEALADSLRSALLLLGTDMPATQIHLLYNIEHAGMPQNTALLIDMGIMPVEALLHRLKERGSDMFLLHLDAESSPDTLFHFYPVYPLLSGKNGETLHRIAHELASDLLQRQKQAQDYFSSLLLYPTTPRQALIRGRIKQELYARGFRVLPDASHTGTELSSLLPHCRAALHLLSSEAENEWQRFHAQSRSHALNIYQQSQLNGQKDIFYRFFWASPEQSRQSHTRRLIDEIEQKESEVPITEVLVLPIGQTGRYLKDRLQRNHQPVSTNPSGGLPILLLLPPEDKALVPQIKHALSPGTQSQLHIACEDKPATLNQKLQQSRHVLIMCINGSADWLSSNIFHILKIKGHAAALRSLCAITTHEFVKSPTTQALPLEIEIMPLQTTGDLPHLLKEWEEKLS